MANEYSSEIQGSLLVSWPLSAEIQGSILVSDLEALLVCRITCVPASGVTYGDLDAYAAAHGYVDSADLLQKTGYATELAYANAHGFETVADFLSDAAYPSWEDILEANGVTFG